MAKDANEELIALLTKISDWLAQNYGPAERELFSGEKPKPLEPPKGYDMFTEQIQEWQWHIETLDVKYEALKRLLEKS